MTVHKKYYIKIRGELVEVPQEVYLAYYRAARRELAQKEQERRRKVLSYDALDEDGRCGSERLPDAVDVEEVVAAHMMHEQLHRCLALLPQAEQDMLRAIYFDGMTERQLHAETGVPQTMISYQKRKALKHLRKLLES